ncbi:hypothetical protein TNCV_1965741 [Trichonephila clavipes]|nr:hypothetical protein TNCV_1965741 [Trichonephila clavipes]
MSTCGREFNIACMRSQSSSFEAAERGSRSRKTALKQMPHVLNRRHIRRISRSKKKLHVLGLPEKSLTVFKHVDVHYPAEG